MFHVKPDVFIQGPEMTRFLGPCFISLETANVSMQMTSFISEMGPVCAAPNSHLWLVRGRNVSPPNSANWRCLRFQQPFCTIELQMAEAVPGRLPVVLKAINQRPKWLCSATGATISHRIRRNWIPLGRLVIQSNLFRFSPVCIDFTIAMSNYTIFWSICYKIRN